MRGMARSVFIAYSSDAGDVPRTLAAKLKAQGHLVFFDESSLPAGEDYDDRIEAAVDVADLMVFFISQGSTRTHSASGTGAYALTELQLAEKKWPNPRGRVLPVQLERNGQFDVPPYLRANVTIYKPLGDA